MADRRVHVTQESEAASEGASTTSGGKALDMVQAGVHSTAVAVAATWALQTSDAEVAEVEDVAPVPVAYVAPEAVAFGASQSNCVIHFEFARM